MRNLLTNVPLRTSKEAPDRTPITPVPESYAGHNFPYRGIETHGVEPTEQPLEPADWEPGRPVHYEQPEPEPQPVPVRIVSEAGREIRRFRTFGMVTGVQGGEPRAIVGRDEERSSVTVKHVATDVVVWVSHAPETANDIEGFPLTTGDTFVTQSHMPIFAWADETDPTSVYVSVEYATGV